MLRLIYGQVIRHGFSQFLLCFNQEINPVYKRDPAGGDTSKVHMKFLYFPMCMLYFNKVIPIACSKKYIWNVILLFFLYIIFFLSEFYKQVWIYFWVHMKSPLATPPQDDLFIHHLFTSFIYCLSVVTQYQLLLLIT